MELFLKGLPDIEGANAAPALAHGAPLVRAPSPEAAKRSFRHEAHFPDTYPGGRRHRGRPRPRYESSTRRGAPSRRATVGSAQRRAALRVPPSAPETRVLKHGASRCVPGHRGAREAFRGEPARPPARGGGHHPGVLRPPAGLRWRPSTFARSRPCLWPPPRVRVLLWLSRARPPPAPASLSPRQPMARTGPRPVTTWLELPAWQRTVQPSPDRRHGGRPPGGNVACPYML